MANYKPLGGKTRRYLNLDTGEEISRRQYLKETKNTSFEEIAANNRARNPLQAALRPARGRKSALKDDAREMIAQARIEADRRRRELDEERRQKRRIELEIQRAVNKKVRRKKVTKALLPAGKMGVRLPFGEYSDYLAMLKEARAIGVVFAYSLGAVMRDEETAQERDATLYPLMSIKDTVDEEDLKDTTAEFIESKSYGLVFAHWFIHLAYSKQYALEKAKRAKRKAGGLI